MTVKAYKILFACLLGFFFCLATFEVDVSGYDNTFFDTYDSYVKMDSKVLQQILSIEFDRFAFPETILLYYRNSPLITVLFSGEPRSSNYFYRPKLFLVKSSFII